MPVKIPVLRKSHIFIIAVVIVFTGLIGASPTIYRRISGHPGGNTSLIPLLTPAPDHKAGDSYDYLFPVVFNEPRYYFPVIKRGYDAFVQTGTPAYLPNFNHPEAGCNWAGVAGQVFGPSGSPVNGYTVVITGSINGAPVSVQGVTGGSMGYGIGGYEIQLSGAPFASTGLLTAYLFDSNLKQVAAPRSLTTFQDCQSNVLLLNFVSGK